MVLMSHGGGSVRVITLKDSRALTAKVYKLQDHD